MGGSQGHRRCTRRLGYWCGRGLAGRAFGGRSRVRAALEHSDRYRRCFYGRSVVPEIRARFDPRRRHCWRNCYVHTWRGCLASDRQSDPTARQLGAFPDQAQPAGYAFQRRD